MNIEQDSNQNREVSQETIEIPRELVDEIAMALCFAAGMSLDINNATSKEFTTLCEQLGDWL